MNLALPHPMCVMLVFLSISTVIVISSSQLWQIALRPIKVVAFILCGQPSTLHLYTFLLELIAT